MEVPLQIAFKDIEPSDFVESRIREEVDKLEQFFDRIISCKVVVEQPEKTHQKGKLYNVRIYMAVPGGDIAVNHTRPLDHAHEDVYVAMRDCFDAARRQLQDYRRKMEGQVKFHDEPYHGRIIRLFPEQGYGFILASDSREIYFHKNSVVGTDFEDLEVGMTVRLVTAAGESPEGPQATTVEPISPHKVTGPPGPLEPPPEPAG